MAGILSSLQGAVGQGVLWGIMVLGIYITFRLMDIADLTVDGSFALGGSVCAALRQKSQISSHCGMGVPRKRTPVIGWQR